MYIYVYLGATPQLDGGRQAWNFEYMYTYMYIDIYIYMH